MFRILLILCVVTIAAAGCTGKPTPAAPSNGASPDPHAGHAHAKKDAGTKPMDDGYPLDTCIVSDEKLGSMGDPVVIEWKGQKVKFCCDFCVGKFNENPAKYLAKLKK